MPLFKQGWTLLETWEPKSRPGSFYEVRRGGDGKVYCTCPAWRFSKGHACRHIKERRGKGNYEPVAAPGDVIVGRTVKVSAAKRGEAIRPRQVG